MKRATPIYITLLFGLLGMLWASALRAQQRPSYFFEEDDIVFQFDIRDYKEAVTPDGQVKKLDFSDLDIYKVALSGSFNNWSQEGWKMKKTGLYTYQLRKNVKSFNTKFPLEFRFVINEKYFAETGEAIPLHRVYDNELFEEAYDAPIYEVRPTEGGNVEFFLAGYPDARQVILTGDFVSWDEQYLKMKKVDGGWEMAIDLPPGRYEYKYIVDGEWTHDPANSKMILNEHHTFNSILFITKAITFTLAGYPNAKEVVLTGSFNDWKEKDIFMEKGNGKWTATLHLIGGKHHYKFIVDGKWMIDPENPYHESDGKGHTNSVLLVQ